MGEFIEERLLERIRVGMAADNRYAVDVTYTANGNRFARLRHGKPYREFDVSFTMLSPEMEEEVASLYHRTYGGFAGFRLKYLYDYTTAVDGVSAYSSADSVLALVSTGIYQLQKEYGRGKTALGSIGRPFRTIYKPVSGAVSIAIASIQIPSSQFSVDTTTGRVTITAVADTVAGITQAAQAVVNVGTHSFVTGMTVGFSGVAGMTEINGMRGTIVGTGASTITVDINTTGFSAWTSGGSVQTRPMAGEVVTGGCEFDIPVAFDSPLSEDTLGASVIEAAGLKLVELLNP